MQFNLNQKQREAVEHNDGPLLIIAGAGTGKTATITERIAYIVNQKWATPSEILALTFTDKAAEEMTERVDVKMPYGYEEMWISTFHSFCDKILRQEAHYLGLDTNYTLMTQAHSYVLFRSYLYEFPLDSLRPLGNPTSFISDILKHFSRLQDENITPKEYLEFVSNHPRKTPEEKESYIEYKELAETYKMWQEVKIKESKLSFADLLTQTVRLLEEKPNILLKYQEKFKYILVDEFQDTNYIQNILVNMLVKDPKKANLTVVGDDDQAIYKFRGAAISNILDFNKKYKNAKKIVLTTNYRSKQEILDRAYDLIQNNNPDRLEVAEGIKKELTAGADFGSEKEFDSTVQFVSAPSSSMEADTVCQIIDSLVNSKANRKVKGYNLEDQASLFVEDRVGDKKRKRYKYSDVAILARANTHTEEFIDALRYYGIPYKFSGPKGLYYRKEVNYLISFLKILADYNDDVNFFNVLRLEVLGLEPRDIIEVLRGAKEDRVSIFEYLEDTWNVRLGSKYGRQKTKSQIDGNNDERLGDEVSGGKVNTVDEKMFGDTDQDSVIGDLMQNNYIAKTFSKNGVKGITNLLCIIDNSYKLIKNGSSIGEVLLEFLKNSGYLEYLEDNKGISGLEEAKKVFMLQNISKYFDLLKSYERDVLKEKGKGGLSYIKDYVEYLDYSIEIGENPSVEGDMMEDWDAVNILTVHSAKGLEFPVVFMVNLVNNRFPSMNRTDRLPIPEALIREELPEGGEKVEHIQEERRLFYVGMTRAKEKLFFTAADYYGQGKRKKKRSIFLKECVDDKLKDTKHSMKSEDKVELGIKSWGNLDDDLKIFKGVDWKKLNLGTHVSYSQLTTYDYCPKKYRYRYILKVPTEASAALTFGSVIHVTLKDFYDQLRKHKEGLKGVFDEPDLDLLLELYKKNWRSGGYDTKKHEELRREHGKEVLIDYFEKFYSVDENPIQLEWWFDYEIDDILIKGAVDRIDLVGDKKTENIKIVDYKTGKVKDAGGSRDLQLALYSIAVEEKMSYKVDEAGFLYVEHGEYVSVDLSEEKKLEAKSTVRDLVKEIRKGDFTATPNPWVCKYCDYKAICSDAKV